MAVQTHKIMRQVLELRGCPEGEARRLQSELREVYYRRLVPLIDKVCSDLAPGRIERIDTLEIDLGAVPLEALESALAGKFEAAFGHGLAAAIGEAPELDPQMELFELFIRSGTVPWWADRSERALLASALENLIERAPVALRRALQAAPDAQRARRRVALTFSDRLLERLAGVMGGSIPAAPWIAALESAGSAHARPARTARNIWWEEVLRALQIGSAPPSAASAAPFLRAILLRVARRLGVDYRRMIADLPEGLACVLEEAATPDKASTSAEKTSAPADKASAPAQLERRLARLGALLASHPGLLARLREIRRLPVQLQTEAARALEAAFFEAGPAGAPQAAAVSSFSDADEIHVENAGLVLLWPFLERFFGNVGLLEGKAFKDQAARQRAIGLLQHLATGEEPAAEYLLPLNKLLCGLPLEEVFDFGEPMTRAEIEACDELLRAAVAQAPVLREMSLPGFRASFLLRDGQLGARDDHWLLRVERLTHDVVLDRFPWSAHVVKLPWMQAHMQVEW